MRVRLNTIADVESTLRLLFTLSRIGSITESSLFCTLAVSEFFDLLFLIRPLPDSNHDILDHLSILLHLLKITSNFATFQQETSHAHILRRPWH